MSDWSDLAPGSLLVTLEELSKTRRRSRLFELGGGGFVQTFQVAQQ